ncbi:MAG: hypothetical protein IOMNBAOH_02834 [Rhodocyclaceae bacterium]|nr:hypothetical protein [Rhodocyclaceae bacterium]
MHKAPEIARFVRTHLRAALPDFTGQYKRRDVLRTRGNLVQWMFVGVSRGGWVRVSPVLSVFGPYIHLKDSEHCKNKDGSFNSDGLIVSVGLSGMSASAARRWSFPPDTPLDEMFASEILRWLKEDAPISFTEPLKDEAIDKALRWFGKDGMHWTAHLFLAYFNMTRGAPTARKDLARAFELFIKHSRYSTDKPPFDFEIALHARFQDLESRLDRPDCIALCRADAEEHARLLKLPAIVWPPEWPEAVPPWPQEPEKLASKIGRLFGKA